MAIHDIFVLQIKIRASTTDPIIISPVIAALPVT